MSRKEKLLEGILGKFEKFLSADKAYSIEMGLLGKYARGGKEGIPVSISFIRIKDQHTCLITSKINLRGVPLVQLL